MSGSWRSWEEEEGTGGEVGVASDWAGSEVDGRGGLGEVSLVEVTVRSCSMRLRCAYE